MSVLEQGGSKMFDLIDKSIDDGLPFQVHLRCVYTEGEEVGQDIIIALAIAIKRSVSVYIAYANPQTFHPNDDVLDTDPVKVAFHEPGHYRAVINENSLTSSNITRDNRVTIDKTYFNAAVNDCRSISHSNVTNRVDVADSIESEN